MPSKNKKEKVQLCSICKEKPSKYHEGALASPGRSDLLSDGVSSLLPTVEVEASGIGAGVGGVGKSGEHPCIAKLLVESETSFPVKHSLTYAYTSPNLSAMTSV